MHSHFALLISVAVLGASPWSRAEEPLAALEPLVGDWTSESRTPDGKTVNRTITYRWAFDHKFLLAESERKVDSQAVRMRITYLYDAPAKTIRAWVIASDGSWSQATVRVEEGVVRLDTRGATPDGTDITLISTLRPGAGATRSEEWTDVRVGGRPQPSPPPIVWTRK